MRCSQCGNDDMQEIHGDGGYNVYFWTGGSGFLNRLNLWFCPYCGNIQGAWEERHTRDGDGVWVNSEPVTRCVRPSEPCEAEDYD